MALLGNSLRSATARAIEPTYLLVIDKTFLDFQLTQIPQWFVSMFKILLERLKQTNEIVDTMKIKQKKYEHQVN